MKDLRAPGETNSAGGREREVGRGTKVRGEEERLDDEEEREGERSWWREE